MPDDQEIADLKKEIKGYVTALNAATTEKEADRYTGLIKSSRENLTELLKEKNLTSKGM